MTLNREKNKKKHVNMASDADDFNENIENLKSAVKKSFTRVYAALKARELKTLRQLDALRKQCESNKDMKTHCVQNIEINYDNESILLENVSKYSDINFEKLNFDSTTFTLEDYITPNDDHMYCYKDIEELTNVVDEDLEAIEEAALKEITRTENCVCYVNIRTEEVARKFRDIVPKMSTVEPSDPNTDTADNSKEESPDNGTEDDKSDSEKTDDDVKKVDPTDDWLNSIKGQTETEPSQVTDVMEHSTIACS